MNERRIYPITGQPITNEQQFDNNQTVQLDKQPAIDRSGMSSQQPAQDPSRLSLQKPDGSQNRQAFQQPANAQSRQPVQQPANTQNAQSVQQPANTQNAQPVQQPASSQSTQPAQQPANSQGAQNFQQPMGNQNRQPMQQSAGVQNRSPFQQPMGNQNGQNFQQPGGAQNRSPFQQPMGNQNGQNFQQSGGAQNRSPFQQPMGNQNGQNFQQPGGAQNRSPFQQPMGNQNGQNFQQPVNNGYGQPMQQSMNNQFRQPMQQPGNNQYGQQFQPGGQNPYYMQGQAKPKKKLTPQSIALGSSIAAVLVLTALLFGFMSSRPSAPEPAAAQQASAQPVEQVATASTVATTAEPAPDPTPTPAPASGNEYAKYSNFSINGKQYNLPMSIDELLENGWAYKNKEDADKTLYASDTDIVRLTFTQKGEGSASFGVVNHSIDAQPLSKCLVYEIDFSDYFIKNTGAEVKFYNDQFELQKTTMDDVKAALGDPSSTNTSGNSSSLTYRGQGDEEFKVSAYYSFDNNILTHISMQNKLMPDDFEQPEVSSKTPDYLSLYKAPAELGKDPLSGNFSLDGTTYNLPVPYKTLAEQGWKCDNESESVPSMKGLILTMKKGDYRLTVEAINPLPNAVTLENTIVVSISAFNSSVNPFDLTIAGNIKLGMTKDELDKALSAAGVKNFKYDEKLNIYRIPYDKDDKSDYPRECIEIFINDSKNTISSIDMERYGWLSDED